MNISEITDIIKDSFEEWYNRNISQESPVTILINRFDEQNYAMKAIHTAKVEVFAVGIRDNLSYVMPLLAMKENYNHGITDEDTAMRELLRKLMVRLYSFGR